MHPHISDRLPAIADELDDCRPPVVVLHTALHTAHANTSLREEGPWNTCTLAARGAPDHGTAPKREWQTVSQQVAQEYSFQHTSSQENL